jgi:uncharacterized protein YrzB (UPF0473 family)
MSEFENNGQQPPEQPSLEETHGILLNEILNLEDEDGETMPFDPLSIIEYNGKSYVVLAPHVAEGEEAEEEEDVYILLIGGEENGEVVLENCEDDIIDAVFEIFKEQNKEDFEFTE